MFLDGVGLLVWSCISQFYHFSLALVCRLQLLSVNLTSTPLRVRHQLTFDKLILFEFYILGPVYHVSSDHITSSFTVPSPLSVVTEFCLLSYPSKPLVMSLHEPLYCQICAIVRSKYSLRSVEIYLERLGYLAVYSLSILLTTICFCTKRVFSTIPRVKKC